MIQLQIQTLAQTYEKLSGGEDFRESIGEFMNAFFLHAVKQRQQLLDDAPCFQEEALTDQQRSWLAFVAGSAEYLARRYKLRCPEWAMNQAHCLPEPWFPPACEVFPGLKEEFLESTPEPFRKRNVFCGDHIFSNPHRSSREPGSIYDLRQRRQAMLKEMSPEEREAFLARYNKRVAKHMRISA
jgi:hypothetical protein